MNLKIIRYLLFLFFISCSSEIKSSNSQLTLQKNLLYDEIRKVEDLYLSNDELNNVFFRNGEAEYFQVIELFYKIFNNYQSIYEINAGLNLLKEDDWVSFFDTSEILIYIGSHILDLESSFDPKHDLFIDDYFSIFDTLIDVDKRYNFNSSRYNNFYINNSLMAVQYFLFIDSLPWFDGYFSKSSESFKRNENVEIIQQTYLEMADRYFEDILYISPKQSNKPVKEIVNNFNDISSAILKNKKNTSLYFPLNFQEYTNRDDIKNIIYLYSFLTNVQASYYYAESFPKESIYFEELSVIFLNSIDFDFLMSSCKDNIFNEFENQSCFDILYKVNFSLTDLYSSSYSNGAFIAKNQSEIVIADYMYDRFSSIKNFENIDKHNRELNFNYSEYAYTEDDFYLIHKTVPLILETINSDIINALYTDSELYKKWQVLGIYNPYNQDNLSINDLYVSDALYWKLKIKEIDKEIILNPTIELFEKRFQTYYDGFKEIATNVNLNDLKENPEQYIDNFGFLREAIMNEFYRADNFLTIFDSRFDQVNYLIEIIFLDRLNKLFYEDINKQNLFEYLMDDFNEEMKKRLFVLQGSFEKTQVMPNYIYTNFNQTGDVVDNYSLYLITKNETNNDFKFKIKKYHSEKNIEEEHLIDFDTFIYDIDTMNSLISFRADFEHISQKFFNSLIRPLENDLSDTRSIVFVLDPLIQNIPIEILMDENEVYLMDKYIISRVNTLTQWLDITKHFVKKFSNFENEITKDTTYEEVLDIDITKSIQKGIIDRTDRLLALGDIDYEKNRDTFIVSKRNSLGNLLWTKKEVDSIQKIVNDFDGSSTKILKKNRATETAFKNQNLNKVTILHFATHGIPIYDDYTKSALMLSPDRKNDGMLTFNEILELDLNNVELTFLSACQMNIARPIDNISYPSLQQALAYAGSKNVISTMWIIDDKATSLFVELFYKTYMLFPSPSMALYQAKVDFLELYPQYSHPYYWAGFINFGI